MAGKKIYYIQYDHYFDGDQEHAVIAISFDLRKLRKLLSDLYEEAYNSGQRGLILGQTRVSMSIEDGNEREYYRIYEQKLI